MKSLLFIAAFCFTGLYSSAQTEAAANARQNISMRLSDIAIVEKTAADASQMRAESGSSLKIQGQGKWIITTKNNSNSTKNTQPYNFVLVEDEKQMMAKTVHTLSKL